MTAPYKATNEFIRKTKDRQSLFVIAALSIALITAAYRLFTEPGRPLIAVLADWAIIALVVVINVFSILIVVKTSKTIIDNGGVDQFLAAERKRELDRLNRQADDNPNMTPEYRAELNLISIEHPELLDRRVD